jgi:predicted SAM-dependent methyltransferase
MSSSIPVLFLLFNRPDKTEKVFARLKEVQPKYLYVACDGPRPSNEKEIEQCRRVREIIDEGISWNCEVHKLYRDENLGCGKAVSSAITWFFEHVEEGIILEDDTLPDTSFFAYCEELLQKYRNSSEVMIVSGDNFRLGKREIADSYNFTKYTHVWGWASWRRVWAHYDFKMKDWPEFEKAGLLERTFDNEFERTYWKTILQKTFDGLEDTWDYQLYYTAWKLNGVSIEPAVNLVKNIGFGEGATHTVGSVNEFIFGDQPARALKICSHPNKIEVDEEGDKITFINRYLNGNNPIIINNSKMDIVKRGLSKIKNALFPNLPVRYLSLYAKKKLLPQKLPVNADNKMYVHLGCGEIDWPKFINVDVRAYEHIHYLHKVDELPFFKDNSADLIYVSHCLEHIPFRNTNTVLNEWRRVLKPGGTLRISVPDFESLLRIYEDNNHDMNSILYPLMGAQDYRFNFHYNAFNFESLKRLLLEAGFSKVQEWKYGVDEFTSLPDWSGKDVYYGGKSYKVSLNIEGIK